MEIILLNQCYQNVCIVQTSGSTEIYFKSVKGFVKCFRNENHESFEVIEFNGGLSLAGQNYSGFEPFLEKWAKRIETALSMTQEEAVTYLESKGATCTFR